MVNSIKKNEDFKMVYQQGKSYANKYLVMYVKKSESETGRIGISVSKKIGNSVVRHRIARLIRESYRLSESKFHSGWDMVVVARQGAKGRNYFEINSAMMHLAKLHRILCEGSD
ncbi:MAG: ribonuclease P protein component [Lachnospiraceae bacterium]|nr:ribonuclease P protein component [Lachnospiraceae bacterium]